MHTWRKNAHFGRISEDEVMDVDAPLLGGFVALQAVE